jgi:hypothetical protein
MKSKLLLGFVAAGSLFLLTNCKTTQVAKFSSVENVMKLELNSTLPEVVSTLGTQPYNIYSKQVDGYTIYVYKYKLVERKVSPEIVNSRGGETTGTEVYNGKEHNLFLFFKDGKLVSMVTSDGRKDSPALIMLENTMYTITRDKSEYIIVPTSTSEATSEPSLPFGGKRK